MHTFVVIMILGTVALGLSEAIGGKSCISTYPLLDMTNVTLLASSSINANYSPEAAKWNSGKAWCSKIDNSSYFEINFDQLVVIRDIQIQGYMLQSNNTTYSHYVAKYHLLFSYDGNTQYQYMEGDKIRVFEGNNGTTDIKNNTLNQRVMTKYMRIIPSPPDGKDTVCLRLSILGCKGVIYPKVKLEGGSYITARINKLHNISCSIESQADVNIMWSLSGGDLSRLATVHSVVNHSISYNHTSVLKLTMEKKAALTSFPCEYSRQLDKYVCNSTLSCQADYSFNKSIKSVDTKQILFTFDLPGAPENLIIECHATSCVFTWEEPPLGDFTKKELMFRFFSPQLGFERRFENVNPAQGKEMTPLVPNTNYSSSASTLLFLNSRKIDIGRRTVHSFRTLTVAPTVSPKIQECKSLNSSAVFISWLPPAYNKNNGVVKRYQLSIIQWKYGSRDPTEVGLRRIDIVKRLAPDRRNYTFSNLTPWSKYKLTLAAYNTDNLKNRNFDFIDNGKEITVDEAAPSGPPRHFNTSKVKSRSISVKWQRPYLKESNGVIIMYEIRWIQKSKRVKRNSRELHSKNTTELFYNISNLKPDSEYLIRVAAFTKAGTGPFTADLYSKTDEAAPEAPVRLTFSRDINNSKSRYILSWEKPFMTNGKLTNYELNILWTSDKSKTVFKKLVDALYTYYHTQRNDSRGLKFRVRAHNKYIGKWSDWAENDGSYRTTKPTPKPPKIVIEKNPYSTGMSSLIIVLIVFIVLFIILIILIIAVFILYRRRLRLIPGGKRHEIEMEEVLQDTDDDEIDISERSPLAPSSESGETVDNGPEQDKAHQPIPVEEFPQYVKRAKENDAEILYREYRNELQLGKCYPWEVAARPENKPKNRYTNICAYDHSRVILKPDGVKKRHESDYVNANHIQGYSPDSSTRYIASHGPTEGTVNDFWRMIWQEKSTVIIMLTNLEETGKAKCYLYWPPAGAIKYGTITVRYHSSDQTADYHIRSFEVEKDGIREKRFITQFHFVSWPDHGVPEFPTAILSLRRRVRHHYDGKAPIIVHCSAGVGRTGCFILIDAMIERIDNDGSVDMFNYLQYMRTRRLNMVQTLDQYIFAHSAVLEHITCGNTEITVGDLEKKIRELKRGNGMEEEFLTLQRTSPDADAHGNLYKVLMNSGYFVNAFYVDGYKRRDAFLVCASPTEGWTHDFWNMIVEKGCHTVVMLNRLDENEQNFHKYWPDLNRVQEHKGKSVILTSEFKSGTVMTRRFKITDTNNEETEHELQHFQFLDWEEGGIPHHRSSLLSLMSLVEKSQQHLGNGPVVVHCSNGRGRSGTFVAVYNSTERLKVEQLIDVLQCVRAIRISLADAVENKDQYQFIYNMIRTYLEAFETYSNFNFVADVSGRRSRSPESPEPIEPGLEKKEKE